MNLGFEDKTSPIAELNKRKHINNDEKLRE
jgi:hypothetical protein